MNEEMGWYDNDDVVLIDGIPFETLPERHREDNEVLVSYMMGMEEGE